MKILNCAAFTRCVIYINDEFIDKAENPNNIMSMYNLIEYSGNYSDTSGSLWQFKRDKSPVTDTWNPGNVSTNNSLWKINMTQFIGNEKINNKFDISRFIYSQQRFDCFL